MNPSPNQGIDPDAMYARADEAAAMLKALANTQRLRILCQLVESERTVGQIHERLPTLSQSALSQHLARLREEGIVGTRRASKQIWYRLVDEPSHRLLSALHGIYCSDSTGKRREPPPKSPRSTPANAPRRNGGRPRGQSR